MPFRIWLSLILLAPFLHALEYKWQKLEGCTLIDGKREDGDSFHVKSGGKDYISRLYFVDTAESESRFPDRIAQLILASLLKSL